MNEKPSKQRPPVDRLGFQLKMGDYIIYGHLLGRCASTRIGKIVLVEWREKNEKTYVDAHWDIRTVGTEDDSYWTKDTGPQLCEAKGKLQFAERTIIVSREFMAERAPTYLKLLEPVTFETKLKKTSFAEKLAKM